MKHTQHALRVLKFTDQEIDAILRIVAAILHMGNIQFTDFEENKALGSKITDTARMLFDVSGSAG